ncbi:MAG: M48 family metalloprotease [Gammaproteobacteria bacterium]|nr:M48 family metalloprotease [Gammaproteobacteria bacterium]MDH3446928.1 M48 family metalloprotease [Gammaproteobacteria bacterium]
MRIVASCIVALGLTLCACATNPVTGARDFAVVSEPDEIDQGRRYHGEIIATYGVYDDARLQQYVNRIGQELASKSHRSHLKFTFTVLDSPDINAFALPGGYVYITRGIMAYLASEAELAGVLGHEIGHVTARHSVRQQSGQIASGILSILITAATGSQSLGNLSNQLGTGLIRGYGREHELEADRLGAEYLHKSGYNPETMLDVVGVLKDQEIYERALAARENREPNIYHGVFSTHPRNDDRLQTVVRAAKNLSRQSYRDGNQDAYYDMIDGLAWGPSIRQGIVVENRFAHPDLAFALQLPHGWRVRNNPQYLEASDPETGALLQVGLVERRDNESLSGLLRRISGNGGIEVSSTAYGATAITRVKPQGGDYQPARISAIALEESQALTLFGTSAADKFAATDSILLATSQSFTRLGQAQVDALRAPRLRIVRRISPSFAALAGQSAIEYDAESILRLLNRAYPDGDIKAIDRLKVVNVDG